MKMSETETPTSLQDEPSGAAPPGVGVRIVLDPTGRAEDFEPVPDVADIVRGGGYEVAFDTADGDAPVFEPDTDPDIVSDSDDTPDTLSEELSESTLPSQAVASRRGRPSDSIAVVIEGNGADGQPRRFIGRDGEHHVESERMKRAFEDYMNLGATRSIAKLATKYFREKPVGWENNTSEQAILRKLSEYSTNLDWQNRIRMQLAHQSAAAITNAQKNASRHRAERIRRSQKLQELAETIFDRAQILNSNEVDLPPEIARQLIKPATTMMQIGLMAERLEIGESLERLKPPKAIEDMTEDELDEWIQLLRSEM